MHSCVKMIREDIKNMNMSRIAPTKKAIQNDIKYAFWHGFINEKIYNELCEELSSRVDSYFDSLG